MLLGVEELACLIHAPNESVDPSEIEHLALAEAIFLTEYRPDSRRTRPVRRTTRPTILGIHPPWRRFPYVTGRDVTFLRLHGVQFE